MNIILFKEGEDGRSLEKRDFRAVHLLKVLHKKEGDEFDAGILGGNTGKGVILGINGGGLEFRLSLTEPPPVKLPLWVAVGFPRPIQLRRLLRDLANFGVERISLLETELGDKNYRDTKLFSSGGAEAALIEGLVQGRDTVLPALSRFPSLEAYLSALENDVCAAGGRGFLRIAADNIRPAGHFADFVCGADGMDCGAGGMDCGAAACLAVGPERGWSDRERRLFDEAAFVRLSMGSRALRTESACIAACALVAVNRRLVQSAHSQAKRGLA